MKWTLGVLLSAILMGWAASAVIPATPVSIDAVSLKFLPPETLAIAFIDVAALRNAPLFQDTFNAKDAAFPSDMNEFIIATGVDPNRDIDRVTIAKLGAGVGFAIVQGRFDKFKVEQFLKDKGRRPEAYLGQMIYRDGNNAFVLLDDVVVAGQLNAVHKAIDQMQLPGSFPVRSDLKKSIETIEPGNQVWAAGDVSISDLGAFGIRGPAPAVEMMKSLKTGTYQMRVDTGISARATGDFADAESAMNFGDLARGTLAVAKLQVARQRPDMLQLLDGIQVSYSSTSVTVRIEESGEQLKKLKDFGPAIKRTLQ